MRFNWTISLVTAKSEGTRYELLFFEKMERAQRKCLLCIWVDWFGQMFHISNDRRSQLRNQEIISDSLDDAQTMNEPTVSLHVQQYNVKGNTQTLICKELLFRVKEEITYSCVSLSIQVLQVCVWTLLPSSYLTVLHSITEESVQQQVLQLCVPVERFFDFTQEDTGREGRGQC